jgi:hypothetical protein
MSDQIFKQKVLTVHLSNINKKRLKIHQIGECKLREARPDSAAPGHPLSQR